jgi:hypothetical protein
MQPDNIDPKFRILADQLFFTDRTDLDLSNFVTLLGNNEDHYRYLWDRFMRSTEIFWDESFWVNRFEFFLTHKPKKSVPEIEAHLFNRFKNLLISNYSASPLYHNPYVQFIAWAKAKANKKENLQDIKDFLISLPPIMQVAKLISVVGHFIPFIFSNIEEYIQIITKNISHSARSLEVIKQFEAQGLVIDRVPINKEARNLLFKRVPNKPNRRAFMAMLNDPAIMATLKAEYKPEHRDRLLALVKRCDYKEIEEQHLRNIKNLLELDASIADDLITTYADRLYARGTGDKGANIKRLIRACKTYPQFSPKKVLAYLSANNRMSDIKFLVASFHDLKLLVPFV